MVRKGLEEREMVQRVQTAPQRWNSALRLRHVLVLSVVIAWGTQLNDFGKTGGFYLVSSTVANSGRCIDSSLRSACFLHVQCSDESVGDEWFIAFDAHPGIWHR